MGPGTENGGRVSVYFIQADEGAVKIGWCLSGNEKARLARLQTGHPARLRIVHLIEDGDRKTEAEMHHRFRKWRLHGEWFRPCIDMVQLAGVTGGDLVEAYEEGFGAGYESAETEALIAAELQALQRTNRRLATSNRAYGRLLRQIADAMLESEPERWRGFADAVAVELIKGGADAPLWAVGMAA